MMISSIQTILSPPRHEAPIASHTRQTTTIEASRLKHLLDIERKYIDIIALGVQLKIEAESESQNNEYKHKNGITVSVNNKNI